MHVVQNPEHFIATSSIACPDSFGQESGVLGAGRSLAECNSSMQLTACCTSSASFDINLGSVKEKSWKISDQTGAYKLGNSEQLLQLHHAHARAVQHRRCCLRPNRFGTMAGQTPVDWEAVLGGQQINQWRNSRRWYSLCVWPHAPYPWSMPRYFTTESAPSTLSISISVMKMNHKIKLVQGLVFDDCDNCNQ